MNTVVYIIRCIIMLLVAWTGARAMGKKCVARMTSYEIVSLMLMVTVAAKPLDYKIVSKATVGVTTIVISSLVISSLSLKKIFYNFDSKPVMVIAKGKILKKELKRLRMNIPLLISELRTNGYQNVSDVEYAIVEPSGKFSIIPKSQARPVQLKDLNIHTKPSGLSFLLIIDGEVNEENLFFLKKDKNWLKDQLHNYGVNKIEDVFLAQMNSKGQLYIDLKDEEMQRPTIV